jgi:hypothetical protein
MIETKTAELEIRDYKAEDGIGLYERLDTTESQSDVKRWAEDVERDIVAYTVVYEGRIVACVGITKILEGVGQCWAIFALDIGDYHIDPRITKVRIRELMIEGESR